MTGMVGNKWALDEFTPMGSIPTAVNLTTYSGGAEDFIDTPLEDLLQQIAQGTLKIQVRYVNSGKSYQLLFHSDCVN